jgi:hypothetical protein
MTLYEDINKATAGHDAWKGRLAKAIQNGKADITPQQAEADDCCDFGRWLYSLPPQTRQTGQFETVRVLHAQFHKQAALVLRLALAGHRQLAKLAMAQGSGFALLSADLVAALRRWKKGRRCGDYPKGMAGRAVSE